MCAFETDLLILLAPNTYKAVLNLGVLFNEGKQFICPISFLFLLKSLIFASKNHQEMCIHLFCDFPPLEPSRGPIPKIPVETQS